MPKRSISYVAVLIAFVFSVFHPRNPAAAANQAETAIFFSQGQAAYNPQDPAASRQQAVQDLMAQGIIQAVGRFLSPSQMGARYPEIQMKILASPSRYIDSYQVFSENQAGASFRVIGQVKVSMEILKSDLDELGSAPTPEKQEHASVPDSSGQPEANPAESEVAQTEGEAETEDDRIAKTPAYPSPAADRPPATAGVRGLSVTKKEILWAVPEKWEQEWVLPADERDANSLFVAAMSKELADYDFSLQLPRGGSTKTDLAGNIPRSQVIAVAEGLGIQDIVTGTVGIKRERDAKQVWIEANLRVIRIGAGKSEFEIQKVQSMEELSNHDAAMALAARVVPELIDVVGGASRGKRKAVSAEDRASEGGVSGAEETPGEWTILIPTGQYAHWREMEALLRRQFKGMQVTSIEMGASEVAIKVKGITGSFFNLMNDTSLPSGALIRVEAVSTESKTVKLFLIPSGKGRAQ